MGAAANPRVAALFPGQGSQHVGMGEDLARNFRLAAEVFEEASDAIGLDIGRLCFNGPESDLTLTENTQPCLLAVSVAALRVASAEAGLSPAAAAGHSLGEYSALVAAGAIPLAAAARWVRERGRAMQRAVPAGQGTMAAILGLDDPRVAELCARATATARARRAGPPAEAGAEYSVECVVEPANFNAPGQIVIAGSSDAVAEAVALIGAGGDYAGGKAIPLAVSAPFHCRLMAPARERLAGLFAAAPEADRPRSPAFPYVPNRTARLSREPGVVFELLVEQVDRPVLWKQSVASLIEAGFDAFVELGPGRVLSGLGKRIAQGLGKPFASVAVGDSRALETLDRLLKGGSP